MNNPSEIIKRFVEDEKKSFEAGKKNSKFFSKYNGWIKEIAEKALPKDISDEFVVEQYFFHLLKNNILPAVSSKNHFKILQNAYLEVLNHIETERVDLCKYSGILLFGKKVNLGIKHYSSMRKLKMASNNRSFVDSYFTDYFLKKLSIFFDNNEVLDTCEEVCIEIIKNPSKKAYLDFHERISLHIILLLSNRELSIEAQNEIFNEKSNQKYSREERCTIFVEKYEYAKNILNYS